MNPFFSFLNTFSENFSSLQQNLTSVSAFQLIGLQKPAVYSAAVTTKHWWAEPSTGTLSEGRFTVSVLVIDATSDNYRYLWMWCDINLEQDSG